MTPSSDNPLSGSTQSQPRRILYADDMPDLRNLMRDMLGREGHDILCVDDGEQAWTEVSTHPDHFDLLITDHHMPALNGLDLVRRARAGGYLGKIVVFSSELSEEVHHAYYELRVDLIMMKPISLRQLRAVLAELWPDSVAASG